ncbi:uncharacterized protein bsd [Chironomus tepperi]|uniref:uncharacterized protein bsd n=1 Tax=Chironomus tepperi TaxID=113505 RepID=UPI00391F7C9A
MKRKRIQNEESNNNSNSDKKVRVSDEGNESKSDHAELDNSIIERKEFVLTREVADNSILCDITGSQWRIGAPVGAGSFGEIYLASNDISKPVDRYNANFVTKIEPHSNGPLFVEIHCLLNVNKEDALENEDENEEVEQKPTIHVGIPKYIASGSHYFNESRYRFLIMPRYKADLHSITSKKGRLSHKHFLIIASQTIDVLQHLHEKYYVHSDIKAQNIMIGQFDTSINGYNNSYYTNNQNNQQKQPIDGKKMSRRSSVQYSGSNPLRTCRIKEDSDDKSHHTVYNDMVRSHYLRPGRTVDYSIKDDVSRSSHALESESSDDSDEDEDFEIGSNKKKGRRNNGNKTKRERKTLKSPLKNNTISNNVNTPQAQSIPKAAADDEDDHVYIIDYGLATKFVDTNGEHRPFCMDQRRAHDGTIEFTSRDAHFGAHSRRSDLECFGYNLIYWSQGYLPWKDEKLKDQPEIVHRLKEIFMTDVKEMLKLLYGKDVPKYLGDFMHYVGQLEFDEEPNYSYLKGLFEKEFLKLGFKKSDMKLNLNEVRDECEPVDKTLSEHDLMMSNITDLKTVTKLGFLVATTDSVDGNETLVKPKESMNMTLSCKASPKNLRSKEKGAKGKRPKRQRKTLTEKEIISEKMAKGKKLSIQEIATLDPEQIARDRAEKEYEKLDEKAYYQTPQRYKGNPTYAILEIENRLRSKQNGSAVVAQTNTVTTNHDIEPIKGYTKPMMDVLKKQQMIVEQQIIVEQTSPISTYQKRNREGLRNVIKHTQKNITYQNEVNSKKEGKKTPKKRTTRREVRTRINRKLLDEIENDDENAAQPSTPKKVKRKPGRPARSKPIETAPINIQETIPEGIEDEHTEHNSVSETTEEPIVEKKRRGRKPTKTAAKIEIHPETEEDSVYYDIPGEGSNDGITHSSDVEESNVNNDSSDDDEPLQKRIRRKTISGDENSNHSAASSNTNIPKRQRGRYYNDEDFEVYTDEASNQSSASHVTKSSASFKPIRRVKNNAIQPETGKTTRQKTKSRSTSRSAAVAPNQLSDHSEDEEDEEEGSEFELDESVNESDGMEFDQDISEEENDDDEEIGTESELDDDDDSDSIDFKYSPIKTRHARSGFSMKQIRGRRVNMLNEDVRNFRLVSTRG